jgi:hypothetical protein
MDQGDREEQAEREAMMKDCHRPMKKWYNMEPELMEKYGKYPNFWQDLKAWEPYREVMKKYLHATEGDQASEKRPPQFRTRLAPGLATSRNAGYLSLKKTLDAEWDYYFVKFQAGRFVCFEEESAPQPKETIVVKQCEVRIVENQEKNRCWFTLCDVN